MLDVLSLRPRLYVCNPALTSSPSPFCHRLSLSEVIRYKNLSSTPLHSPLLPRKYDNMEAEASRRSLTRDGPSAATIKPYFKLRLGGSRSVVTGKFPKDTLLTPNRRHDPSPSSLEPTRSRDSHSISSRSTDSSVNQEKVRMVGRGGAGARPRNHSKAVPVPTIEMKPLNPPQVVLQEEIALRRVGRGGLGSRPQGTRGKGKAVDASYKPKKSKQFRRSPSLDRGLRPQSQVSSISTIHFAGESGLPPPDFFKVTKKRSQQSSLDIYEMDEECDSNQSSTSHRSRETPSAVPWDDTPTTSQSNLARAKAKRRERGLSLLFSMFQHDATRKPDSGLLVPPSMSIPSQITLTSIETDPSYFFHGPGSPPSTPPCGQETDSTTESSYSARLGSSLSSFQREPSPSPMPSPKKEVDDSQDEEIHEPSLPQTDRAVERHPSKSQENVLLIPDGLGMHLSASEAEALGSPPCSPFLQENISFVPLEHSPTIPGVRGLISKDKLDDSDLWTGEWNVGMVEVIRALRELR